MEILILCFSDYRIFKKILKKKIYINKVNNKFKTYKTKI